MENVVERLVRTGISVAGGFVGSKLVEAGWRAVTGEDAPKDADDMDFSVPRVVAFAAISASISALIQAYSSRGAQAAIAKMETRRKRGQELGADEV